MSNTKDMLNLVGRPARGYPASPPITGVHTNQDQIWLVKIGKYMGFYVDRRS